MCLTERGGGGNRFLCFFYPPTCCQTLHKLLILPELIARHHPVHWSSQAHPLPSSSPPPFSSFPSYASRVCKAGQPEGKEILNITGKAKDRIHTNSAPPTLPRKKAVWRARVAALYAEAFFPKDCCTRTRIIAFLGLYFFLYS